MAVKTSDFPAAGADRSRAGAYPIALVRATMAGFVGRTDRGPLDEPTVVRSFAEFYQLFGGHIEESFVSHCVQDYFLHGGTAAVIVRVANRATRAEILCPAGDDSLVLAARYPGSQEVLRVSIDYDGVEGDPARFNLVVQRLRRGVTTVIADQELFPGVSVDHADDRYLVDVLSSSRLITVAGSVPSRRPDPTPPVRPGDPIRYIGMSRPGTDGQPLTDYDLIGSRARGTGLFAFDRGPRIDLLCIPPLQQRDLGPTVLLAAERICAARNSLYIFDAPWSWDTADQAIAGARSIDSASRHVLAYYPRIRPRGDRARFAGGLPACGAIAGLLAHRDARGSWQGEGDMALKTSLTVAVELSSAQAALLQRSGVNVFARGPAGQTRLAGNLTLGGARRVGRRSNRLDHCRLVDFVLTSVEAAAGFALEHYYGGSTLEALERQLRQFLSGLHERGVLAGTIPAQAYFVRTESGDDSRPAAVSFGIAPDRPGEFVAGIVRLEHGQTPVVRLTAGLEAERMLF